MREKNATPKRIYKYRPFSNRTIDMLVEDSLFFADPSTFNDPLDSKPTLNPDLDAGSLEQMLRQMVEERIRKEMEAGARVIKYRGPKTIDHIARHSRLGADQLVADVRYSATDPYYDMDDPERFLFGRYVEAELLKRYDSGVVSLAERPNCPLMWSHYGDQHRGLCVGYSIPSDSAGAFRKVQYGGGCLIDASAVAEMISGDEAARRKVDDAVLFRKASDWRYEREWRLIGARGVHDAPIELEEVVFGLRCDATVKYAIVKALEDRNRPVKFYEIRQRFGTLLLDKNLLDTDDLKRSFPRRARSLQEAFSDVDVSG